VAKDLQFAGPSAHLGKNIAGWDASAFYYRSSAKNFRIRHHLWLRNNVIYPVQMDLTTLGQQRGVLEYLQYVFSFQVRVVRKHFSNGVTSSKLTQNHGDSDPHPSNAGLSTHYFRMLRDAVKLFHNKDCTM
jgi:hypothetical protein